MAEELTPKILVIDDEPSIRLGLTVAIRRHGYQVMAAEDGKDGLQKAKEYSPDLIISDVMMPPPDGFELKRLLDTDPRSAGIPFIFLTARSGASDRITGIRDGADDYISKPFVMEELLARMDALLRRVRTAQERGREQMVETARNDMEKLRSEILQNFHHELRTPLMNIITPLELTVNNKFSEPEMQSHFIRMALSNADRLESLVSDIIILSNIELGNLNNIRQSIDVNDHILKPIERRLERYKDKKLQFTHHIVDGGPVKAPRKEFTQSIVHLLDNAFKFSKQDGKINLDIFTGPNGGIKIVLSDEGPGIPLDQREKVFDKFYQVSRGDSREYEGLGVGLTIAKMVFSQLGGSVKIGDPLQGCLILAEFPDIRPGDIVYG